MSIAMKNEPGSRRQPVDGLPKRPEDIDLDRVVTDLEYRAAVKELLRRWGIGDRRPGKLH